MGRHTDREPARGYDDYGDYADHHRAPHADRDSRTYADHPGYGDRGRSGGYDEGYGDRRDAPESYDTRTRAGRAAYGDRSVRDAAYESGGYDSPRDRRDARDHGRDYGRDDDVYGEYDFRSSAHEPAARAKAKAAVSVEEVQAERMSKMEAAYERRGGTRRAGSGKRRVGGAKDEEEAKALQLKKRKRKRRWIALACVLVMFTGVGIVGGTIFFESVTLPGDIPMPESNVVQFNDGSEMARLGSAFRLKINMADLPDHVKYAVIAAEDQTFYENPGVDFKGVLRAFWNNVTGGETQGASTITQQYAGLAADLRDQATYGRKAREAVIAMKLDDKYTKDEILGFYLDLVPFGRTAEGIGAAAKAFFNKEAKDLTPDEAALLAGQIKSPNGIYDPQDPLGMDNDADVRERWNYVLDSMVKIGKLDPATRATYVDPPKTEENTSNPADSGKDKDTGFVSHQRVYDELQANYGISKDQIVKQGGYTIVTTIDPRMQEAARNAASTEGSVLKGQPDNLRAALVAVDPKTGEVKAYYGGSDNGSDADKAGPESPHQPGSSFKVFTMLTALKGTDKMGGASIDSLWDSTSPKQFDDRESKVSNSENDNSCGKDCKMLNAIRKSLNVPTYSMTKTFGAANVVATARDMGIDQMKGGQEEPCKSSYVDLNATPVEQYHNCFDNEVGFGQYEVPVEDMAAAFATLANKGERTPAHFIKELRKGDQVVEPTADLKPKQVIDRDVAIDARYVMSTIHPLNGPNTLPDGSQYAGKTGTWERSCEKACDENSQNWYVAFTNQLAAASWLGDATEENGSLKDKNGNPTYGSGISGQVWLKFMNEAMKYVDDKTPTKFEEPTHTGSATNGDHAAPVNPTPTETTPPPDGQTPTPGGGTPTPTPGGGTPTPDPGGTTPCPIWDPKCNDNGRGNG